jgi:hypothetical protein
MIRHFVSGFPVLGDFLWISEYDILFSSAKYNISKVFRLAA